MNLLVLFKLPDGVGLFRQSEDLKSNYFGLEDEPLQEAFSPFGIRNKGVLLFMESFEDGEPLEILNELSLKKFIPKTWIGVLEIAEHYFQEEGINEYLILVGPKVSYSVRQDTHWRHYSKTLRTSKSGTAGRVIFEFVRQARAVLGVPRKGKLALIKIAGSETDRADCYQNSSSEIEEQLVQLEVESVLDLFAKETEWWVRQAIYFEEIGNTHPIIEPNEVWRNRRSVLQKILSLGLFFLLLGTIWELQSLRAKIESKQLNRKILLEEIRQKNEMTESIRAYNRIQKSNTDLVFLGSTICRELATRGYALQKTVFGFPENDYSNALPGFNFEIILKIGAGQIGQFSVQIDSLLDSVDGLELNEWRKLSEELHELVFFLPLSEEYPV